MINKILTLEELENLVRYKILKIGKNLDVRKNLSSIQSSKLNFDKRFIVNENDKSYYYLLYDGITSIVTLPDNINLLKNQYNFPKGLVQESKSKSSEEDFPSSNLFSNQDENNLGDIVNERKKSLLFLLFRNSFLSFLKSDLLRANELNTTTYSLDFYYFNQLIQLIKKDDFFILNLLLLIFREDLIEIEENKFSINRSLKRLLEELSKHLKEKNIILSPEFKGVLGKYLKSKDKKDLLTGVNDLEFIDSFIVAIILFYETHEKMKEYSFEERLESYQRLRNKLNDKVTILYQFLNEAFYTNQFNPILSDKIFIINKLAFKLTYRIDREDKDYSILKEFFKEFNSIEFCISEIISNYEKLVKDKLPKIPELKLVSSSKEIVELHKKSKKKTSFIIKVEDLKEENSYKILNKLRQTFEQYELLKSLYIIDEINPKEDVYSLDFKNKKDKIINLIEDEFQVKVVYISKVANTKAAEITRIIENSKDQLRLENILIDESVRSITYLPAILSAVPINTKRKYFFFEEKKILDYFTLENN